jgi:multiple sugar transport system permease protein
MRLKSYKGSALTRYENRWFFIFILPWILGFIFFQIGPMIFSLIMSLCNWEIIAAPQFIGLDNYKTFWTDPLIRQSFKVTFLYSLMTIPTGIVLGVLLALLMNQAVKGITMFRTLYYLPAVTSAVSAAILWIFVFDPQYGILNFLLLKFLGIKGPPWFGSETWALPALAIMTLWGIGGSMIIYLAALQSIPTQLYEAAEIDGANSVQQFFRITLPMLTPAIFFNLVMGIIGALQAFTQAFVTTNGGPANATLFYALYLYNNAFRYYQMGYASALAWMLLLVIFIITRVVFKTSNWVYYEVGT